MAVQLREGGDDVALIVGDSYPGPADRTPPPDEETDDGDRKRPDPAEKKARIFDLVRREAGNILGAISEEEVLLLADIFHKSAVLAESHEFHRFDGDMLLLVAPVGKRLGDKEGDSFPFTELWEPYVSGEITQARLPCSHAGILLPEMLGEAWSAVSAWLGLDD
jgi:hypothetical protein